MFKYKFFSLLAIVSFLSFSASAQSPAWSAAHKKAHSKEQLATNKSRLDASFIESNIQKDILSRESDDHLSSEGAMLIEDLLKEASSHLGKKYRLGSKGPNAFDCSGFSGYVYRQFGFSIGASSRDQYKIGKNVDIKDLRKGDLVFFTSRSSGRNVGHVGIVWDVNPETGAFRFIHSSTRHGVIITDFAGYYVKRFVGAKRVIE